MIRPFGSKQVSLEVRNWFPARSGHDPSQKTAWPLRSHLWQSYLKTALIPLMVIELSFLVIYWIGSSVVFEKNANTASAISTLYFSDIAKREANTIGANLEAIASHTRVFSRQTLAALEGNHTPSALERDRYIIRPGGGLYTRPDDGTTSSFYPGRVAIGPDELNKVLRLSVLDPLMVSIVESNENISSIYFNSYETYNRIYPAISQEQFPDDVDVTVYNFYYEADAEHNPQRRDVWTSAYVDPAGRGWMVSSIAPVWKGDRLEGVVGLDVTLNTIIDSIINLDLPWGGYAMLIDQDGVIIAMPSKGEEDFGSRALTEFNYSEPILADTFMSDSFNINLREDARPLAAAMLASTEGEVKLQLGGEHLASFSTVPQTGWKLVIIAPTDEIFGAARLLRSQLQTVGYLMIAGLLVFYLLFFALLLARARSMSTMVARPLTEISGLIEHIGERNLDPEFSGSGIVEIDRVGKQLLRANRLVLSADRETLRQVEIAKEALIKLQAANEEAVIFARTMSHQIRTPLSVIDSSAQIIQRNADILAPKDLRSRAGRVRDKVAAIADLLSSLVARFDTMAGDTNLNHDEEPIDLRLEVARLASEIIPPEKLVLQMADDDSMICAKVIFLNALREIIGQAVLHSKGDRPIEIGLSTDGAYALITVTYDGAWIATAGANSVAGTEAALERYPLRGLGISLSLSRKVIEHNGGKFDYSFSDQTTAISITIPCTRKKQIGSLQE